MSFYTFIKGQQNNDGNKPVEECERSSSSSVEDPTERVKENKTRGTELIQK